MREHLERAERLNPQLNAIVTFFDDTEERAAAAPAGPLHGVPFTIKDTFDTARGRRAARGSSPITCPPRTRLRLRGSSPRGAVPVGKTNSPEFALWWETGNLVFGRTANPHDPKRTAGGSSGARRSP